MGPLKSGVKENKKRKRVNTNPGVGVDFKKVKHKVGKRLPRAQNETNTNFSAKTINLPSQGVKDDKESATNYHNLTLKELLAQTSHYSDKPRKQALVGLGDLFSRYPNELRAHVGMVYSRLVERMADAEPAVRTALQALLREHVVPLVPAVVLQPFLPMIMAHVCGAMTHLNLEVRNDALLFLDIMMDHCPKLVAVGFMEPCLLHFCDLLSNGHRSRNIKGQSLKSLLKVLRSLCEFLRRAFPASSPAGGRSWQEGGAPLCPAPHTSLYQDRCAWAPAPQGTTSLSLLLGSTMGSGPRAHGNAAGKAADKIASGWSGGGPLAEGGAPGAATAAGEGVPVQPLTVLGQRLVVLLYECWAQCDPGQLSLTPEFDSTTALVCILTATNSLLDHLIMPAALAALPALCQTNRQAASPALIAAVATAQQVAEVVLRHVAPAFPARAPTVKPPAGVTELLSQYNLKASHALVHFLPLHRAVGQGVLGPAELGRKGKQADAWLGSGGWSVELARFYLCVLEQGVAVPPLGATLFQGDQRLQDAAPAPAPELEDDEDLTAAPKAAQGYGSQANSQAAQAVVLQGVQAAVSVAGSDVAERLLQAVSSLAARLPGKASLRVACLRLQHSLLWQWRQGQLHLQPQALVGWLQPLPRLLWELSNSSPDTSGLALRMLLDAARFSTRSTGADPDAPMPQGQEGPAAVEACLSQMQPQLAPLFSLQLPVMNGVRGTVVAGAVTKLDLPLQELAVDVLHHLGPLQRPLLSALVCAVQSGLLAPAVAQRAVEVVVLQCQLCRPHQAAGVLLTLLFPHTGLEAPAQGEADHPTAGAEGEIPGTLPQAWQRHQALCDTVQRMLPLVAPPSVLLQLLSLQLQTLVAPPTQATTPTPKQATNTPHKATTPKQAAGKGKRGRDGTTPKQAATTPSKALTPKEAAGKVAGGAVAMEEDGGEEAGGSDTPAPHLMHLYSLLHLAAQVLEEQAAGHPGAQPLPPWLEKALPSLVAQFCGAHAAVVDLLQCANAAQEARAWQWSGQVVLRVCRAQPSIWVLPVLQAAAASVQPAAQPGPASYAAALELARCLVGDHITRLQCLQQPAATRAAVESLLSPQLPASLTGHACCLALAQRLRHGVQDLLGGV